MRVGDVVRVLEALAGVGAEVWVEGGWGVDALLGEATRVHGDLDLVFRQEQEAAVVAALAELGFEESLDWRPVRFVVSGPLGGVDLHPVELLPDGSAVQQSFDPAAPFRYPAEDLVTGVVGGVPVRCISARLQAEFHQGYRPRPQDIHDMARLREAFDVQTHF